MSTITVNKSHATINVGASASYIVLGDDDTILVGSNSSVTANGSALNVQITGAGSVVTIGGNGVAASNTNDNVVLFKGVTGTLHELANSRVDVTGNLVQLTMAGNDALGVYGHGDTVAASGVGDALWIGQNGFGVTGAALDFVTGLTHGSVYEMQGSSLETSGSYYSVTLNAQDLLLATGLGVHVTVTTAGDQVSIGGNGSGASNTDEDVVLFQAGGAISLAANSRVDTTGSSVTATLAANDTFGLYGSAEVVNSTGTGDAIWIGQNGMGSIPAGIDSVHNLINGSVYEMQNSDVGVDGTNYHVIMSGDGRLALGGSGASVSVTGANNIIIGQGASINATYTSSLQVYGGGNTVNYGGGGAIEIFGGGNNVTVSQGATVTIDQDQSLGGNTLDWRNAPVASIAPITIDGGALASLTGSTAIINLLGGGNRVTVTGSSDSVSDSAGGNTIAIGGNGYVYQTAGQDKVTVKAGDNVTLLAHSNVFVTAAAGVTSSQDNVAMGLDDALGIGTGVTVDVGLGVGNSYLANFGTGDVLNLAAFHFSSVDDLMLFTGYNHLNQTNIQLGVQGDNLALSITHDQLLAYANAGLVKLS